MIYLRTGWWWGSTVDMFRGGHMSQSRVVVGQHCGFVWWRQYVSEQGGGGAALWICFVEAICLRAGWWWGSTVDMFGGGSMFEPLPGSRRSWLRFFVVVLSVFGPTPYKAVLKPVCYKPLRLKVVTCFSDLPFHHIWHLDLEFETVSLYCVVSISTGFQKMDVNKNDIQLWRLTWHIGLCFFFHGATLPSEPGPRFRGFTIILTHTTLGSTLDEWSGRCRALYITTQYTRDRHPYTQRDSNPQSQRAGRRPTP